MDLRLNCSLFWCVVKEQRFRLHLHLMSLSAPRGRPSLRSPQHWTPPSSPMLHSPAISRPKSEHSKPHTRTLTQKNKWMDLYDLFCVFVGLASWSKGLSWTTTSWNIWNMGRYATVTSILLMWLILNINSLVGSCVQILTIMDCMYPTSLAKGCCVIQEGDDGSTVYVLEGKAG